MRGTWTWVVWFECLLGCSTATLPPPVSSGDPQVEEALDAETRLSMERCAGHGFFMRVNANCLCLPEFDGDACERGPDEGSLAARVLASELDPASVGKDKQPALIYAAAYGRCELVKALLDGGADPNLRCPHLHTPLMQAALGGNLCSIRLLIERGARPELADDGLTPLTLAALGGHAAAVEVLLNASPEVARWPMADDGDPFPLTALPAAVLSGSRSTTALLLLRLRNSPEWTSHAGMALAMAAASNDVEAAKAIVQADHTSALITGYGVTALTMAAAGNHYEAVEYVLSLGVDAAQSAGDIGPMVAAAAQADERLVQLLLEHEGNVNERDFTCYTPLMTAAENDNLAAARMLLAGGADPRASAGEGLTAHAIAEARGHDEMARLLSETDSAPSPPKAAPACESADGAASADRTGPHGVITRQLDAL